MVAAGIDVLAIGNAIVDVIAPVDDAFLAREGIAKGSMRPIGTADAVALYERMPPAREMSGGSAANTVAGLAALGRQASFVGQVAADQLGTIFRHDIVAQGVSFTTAPLEGGLPTGRCLVLVTPDGQRTMSTSLGAAEFLPPAAIDPAAIRNAAILYLEGYMWRADEPRAAMLRAIEIARAAGRQIAFTPSSEFCIERDRADFRALIERGQVDILFVNEAELQTLVEEAEIERAIAAAAARVPILVLTRSERGALCVARGVRHEVAAEPIARVVDTTGAGDLFAAGFLAGHCGGEPVARCLRMGAIAAAEIISHFGARPEAELGALMAAKLG